MKKTLTIAPLSTPDTLTVSAWKAVETAPKLYLQTQEHPSACPVLKAGLPFVSMDDLRVLPIWYQPILIQIP